MSTTSQAQHRHALRPCCPSCQSFGLTQFKRTYGCNSCKASFVQPEYRAPLKHRRSAKDAPPPKRRSAGSGVIAQPRQPIEPRPLTYDMMAHARLAMAARGR